MIEQKDIEKTMKNIQSIISQMTLEEKAALCTGASPWTTTPGTPWRTRINYV
ncbi:MAG TPA: hypothetical protein VK249_13230 [Anaerolineales bacterium]|nr:hypothetical protein [Anaerolineales bacterium]